MRAWRDGTARVEGFLDDHACVANGLFDLYESAFDRAHLRRALSLVDRILEDFWEGGLYFTPARSARSLVHRPLAPLDGACPSGLSASVFALLRAHGLSGTQRYLERARELLERFEPAAARNTFGFAHLLAAREFERRGPGSIMFQGNGEALQGLQAQAHRSYLPGMVLALEADLSPAPDSAAPASGAAAVVCRDGVCLPSVRTPDELRQALAPAQGPG
jgi:hypothetical protein